MNKEFKSLILYPTIFIVVLLGVLTAKNSFVAYLIFLFLCFEQIFSWNKSINSDQNYDYRIFFAEQYLNIVYLVILFPLYLVSSLLWPQINFWILFGYGLNFIIFRSIASVGTNQLSKTNFSKSREIKSTLELWKSNKTRLSLVLSKTSNDLIKEKLKDKLEYSSFLNTNEASSLLDQAENADGKKLESLLKNIDELM